jgi:hypothetical protein
MIATPLRVAAMGVALCAVVSTQPAATFSPPRILSAAVPDLPAPNVVGGGEVLIEATIDRNGGLARLVLLRSTPPYTDLVLSALSRWRFQPARASNGKDPEVAVEAPILIAAVYRPPTLFNSPTAGEPPKDLSAASGEVAFPAAMVPPVYPPNAAFPAVVLFEVVLDENGRIGEMLPVASDPGFEGAARDALMQWTFRPGLVRGRPGPATAYVIFGFRPPVIVGQPPLPPKPPTPPN